MRCAYQALLEQERCFDMCNKAPGRPERVGSWLAVLLPVGGCVSRSASATQCGCKGGRAAGYEQLCPCLQLLRCRRPAVCCTRSMRFTFVVSAP